MKTLLSSALLVLTTSLIHAQFITWSAPSPITGDSDIVTTGTYIDAVKTGLGGPAGGYTTGNGVVFHTHTDPGAFSDGTIAITGDQPNGMNTGIGTASTPDAAYNAVLTGILYFYNPVVQPPVGTATFSGLTSGDSYRIEIWNTAGASWGNTTYEGLTPADSVAFANDFATGTFIATGPTASFSITGPQFPMISAIALYSADAIPEPSTYGALALGLVMLAGITRWRRTLAA